MNRAELIDTVLENLGVLAAGQTISAEDAVLVGRRLEAVVAQLQQEDVASIGDLDNFEDALAMPLSDIVAFACAAPYGITGQRLVELAAANQAARAALQVLFRRIPATDTLAQPRWWGARRGGGAH